MPHTGALLLLHAWSGCEATGLLSAQWQRQYAHFSRTRLGQLTFVGALAFLAYTGLLFRLLNLLFILWWLAPLLILPLSNYLNKKASRPLVSTLWRCVMI